MKSQTICPKRTSDEETEGSVLRIGTGLVYGDSLNRKFEFRV